VRQSNSGLDKTAAGEWTGIALAMKESPLPGNYNSNGIVDSADYTVWRNGLGSIYTQADYVVWKAHFGETSGGGSAGASPSRAAVPEPASVLLIAFGAALVGSGWTRRWQGRGPNSSCDPGADVRS
jgi:hypothetical protein